MYVEEMSLENMSAEYCDGSSRVVNVIDGAIEVDSLEVSTGDAAESNNSFLYVERFGQRKERMKVNTCEYDGKSECSVSYVERFGQRKQSSEANTYVSISSLKVDEFDRAEKFSRVGNDENGLEDEKLGSAGNGRDRQEVEVTERTGSVTANVKVTRMACDSNYVSIGQVKVNEKSVSEFRVEQGRELSIARQFPSVMKRHGSNRSSEVDVIQTIV